MEISEESKKTLNSLMKVYYKGVEFMELKRNDVYQLFLDVNKKIKGKISKKEVSEIEQILEKNLVSKPLIVNLLNIQTFLA